MNTPVCRSELILGGQKSGKSRRAEALAQQWLAASPTHRAVLIATAQPWDAEMRQRIARHQQDRAERVPGMATVEEPMALAEAIAQHSRPDTLVVVDCLTLWLTNLRMPWDGAKSHCIGGGAAGRSAQVRRSPRSGGTEQNALPTRPLALVEHSQTAMLLGAIDTAPGPLVLVGNEIGLGVIPMGAEVRAFVDALGRLNQDVAQHCQRVTLMAAGLPLTLKDSV
ncbi:bifunctional adenosylcobinamide kinase/adenosylcobinamide-phosphate guanylyltransferase [Candidatus Aalborgicola defluviihabitans]|uniref:bifunctional adenosylcobinamide kinase/adenosylcobinamide-phosphate guanylyltransferase n=1 Tax=Candidatus Aalborgicola defluviihabitans TaxID=3386187 RepID=UPI003908C6C8|nr:bifunctional adenosylcobinamide kinase/adenosylcobinamide-phosphate guanylyltransferase [Burkholderiales bacterium]